MKKSLIKLALSAATVFGATTAFAGGFSTEGVNPGGALFNYKSFVVQGAIGYAMPDRRYTNGAGFSQSGVATGSSSTKATNNYSLLSFDIKGKVNDNIDCALRGHQPWRLENEVSPNFVGRYEQSSFIIDSKGLDLTCSYSMDVSDNARFRVLAGARAHSLDATRTNAVTGLGLVGAGILPVAAAAAVGGVDFTNTYKFSNDDLDYGFRVGASYEIPEYLLRAQVIYDSEIKMNLTGTQTMAAPGIPVFALPATTSLTLPQSISARVQSGINETTLVFGGVKWQNWGAIKQLNIAVANPALNRTLTTGWRDGWTIEAGFGKKLTDDFSAQASLTWNQGIGGGYTDTWTLALGGAYDLDDNWRLTVGGSATLLTSSTETSTGVGGGASAVTYNQGNDWALGIGAQLQYSIR